MDLFKKKLIPLVFMAGIIAVLTVATYLTLSFPSVKLFSECFTTSMYEVHFCASSKQYTKYKSIPNHLIQALITSEDASFFSHHGFDFDEIQKSFQQNLKSKTNKRGASTISQQLIKNAFLTKEKSYIRKFKEAILTLQLENNYTKKQILGYYLNIVEFAPKIYGIKAAANYYFHKDVSDITPVESSFLVQLLPNPKAYSRGFFQPVVSERVFNRTKLKFLNLYYYKRITEEQYQAGLQELSMPPWSEQIISPETVQSELEDVEYLNQAEEQLEVDSPTEESSPEETTPLEPLNEEDESNTQ
ncbi:MAG: transglycosylase domain-containing protein [Bdellovibrionales bacterium]|nr:transglycosylase domain-containing protein [Bdellovibrionales bacterium]